MGPNSKRLTKTRQKRKTPNEAKEFSHCRMQKVQKIVFRRLLHNIMCLILLNARDCAKSSNGNKQKNIYSQLNDVYLKLNLLSEFMRTNQHICANTHSPLIMSVSRSFHPQRSFYFNVEDEYSDKIKTEKNILSHPYSGLGFSVCAIDMCQPTNKGTKEKTRRRSMYVYVDCIRCVILMMLEHAR